MLLRTGKHSQLRQFIATHLEICLTIHLARLRKRDRVERGSQLRDARGLPQYRRSQTYEKVPR